MSPPRNLSPTLNEEGEAFKEVTASKYMKYRLILEYRTLLDMMAQYLRRGQPEAQKLALKEEMENKFAEVNQLEIYVGDQVYVSRLNSQNSLRKSRDQSLKLEGKMVSTTSFNASVVMPQRRRNADQADVEDLINQLAESESKVRESEEWTVKHYMSSMTKSQSLLMKYNEINQHKTNLEIELEDLQEELRLLKVPREPDLERYLSQGILEDMLTKVVLKVSQCQTNISIGRELIEKAKSIFLSTLHGYLFKVYIIHEVLRESPSVLNVDQSEVAPLLEIYKEQWPYEVPEAVKNGFLENLNVKKSDKVDMTQLRASQQIVLDYLFGSNKKAPP